MTNTDVFKKINWHADVKEIDLSYNVSYTLLPNSSDNSTFLIWEENVYKTGDHLLAFSNALEIVIEFMTEKCEMY